jgi:hypothetical protein
LENAMKQLDSGNHPTGDSAGLGPLQHRLGAHPCGGKQKPGSAPQDVLGIYRRSLGSQHPNVGEALHSLAIVYQDLSDSSVQAEQFYRQAIDFHGELWGGRVSSGRVAAGVLFSLLTELDRSTGRGHAGSTER